MCSDTFVTLLTSGCGGEPLDALLWLVGANEVPFPPPLIVLFLPQHVAAINKKESEEQTALAGTHHQTRLATR